MKNAASTATIALPQEIKAQLSEVARRFGVSASGLVEFFLEEYGATVYQQECIVCGEFFPMRYEPYPVDDEEGWKAVASYHSSGCKWLKTRAFRLKV